MRVAIISSYYKEPLHVLRRCHESVLAQKGDITHFMIADGFPCSDVDSWEGVVHINIPNHGDYGDTPRGIGAACASASGYDAICFLDADNWYEPNHIETMRAIVEETGGQVVTSARRIFAADGRQLGVCKESNGFDFNDTNCYFLTRATFPVCAAWLFKASSESIVGDRIFWDAVRAGGYVHIHSIAPTVNYVTTFAFHYQMFGETPPDDSKVIVQLKGQQHFQMVRYAQFKTMRKVSDC